MLTKNSRSYFSCTHMKDLECSEPPTTPTNKKGLLKRVSGISTKNLNNLIWPLPIFGRFGSDVKGREIFQVLTLTQQ